MTIQELLCFAQEIEAEVNYEVRDTRTYTSKDKSERVVKVTSPVHGSYASDSIIFEMDGEQVTDIKVGESVNYWIANPLVRAFEGVGIGEQGRTSMPEASDV